MGSAVEATGLCLENTSQLPAWSCDMPPASLQVTIANLGLDAPKTSNHAFSVKLPDGAQQGFSYGTQPPVFRPKNVMTLVSDYDDPHLGPAWFFQVNYDKVVILPAELLTAPSAKARKRRGNVEAADGTTATPTDAAALQTSSSTETATSSPTAPATNNYNGGDSSSGGGGPPPNSYPRHNVVVAAGSTPWFCYWHHRTHTRATTSSSPQAQHRGSVTGTGPSSRPSCTPTPPRKRARNGPRATVPIPPRPPGTGAGAYLQMLAP
ncbi:hypothetical protein V499_05250 [Pseudogymnoascus sp. VKM F-103]|nr:hypothetical protein V499_05250 [Pseudogymnoascus sp. VKM F-103]